MTPLSSMTQNTPNDQLAPDPKRNRIRSRSRGTPSPVTLSLRPRNGDGDRGPRAFIRRALGLSESWDWRS